MRKMVSDVSADADIENVEFISSRGCAYIVMRSRSAAFDSIRELVSSRRRDEKRKVDWGMNAGVKNNKEIAEFFSKSEGATFIPYDKLPKDIQVATPHSSYLFH